METVFSVLMIYECADYRSFLKNILVQRIKTNPSYSLRAFSNQIGVSASMLSEVLNGSKKLSPGKASIIANRLNLESDEERYFIGLVQLDGSGEGSQRDKVLSRLKEIYPRLEMRDLSIDHFHSIADWVCVAGLTLLDGFPGGLTADEIASRLDVSKLAAFEAMERWVRLDLVEMDVKDKYRRTSSEHLMMASQAPQGALKRFHRTMLEKAVISLEKQSNQEKYLGSETLAFDPADLPAIERIVEKAIGQILAKAKTGKKRTSIYHFGFQFFRLTKKEK